MAKILATLLSPCVKESHLIQNLKLLLEMRFSLNVLAMNLFFDILNY